MTFPKQPEQPDTKTLNDQVKDSSDKNRQFFLAYLALMAYVQASVFSTTDTMLLFSDQGTKLPLIDITVPLLGFYWVIPLFILAIHFNFLQNLEAHHFKLMQWRHTFSGKAVPRSRIQPFLFDVATFDTGSMLQGLTGLQFVLMLLSWPNYTGARALAIDRLPGRLAYWLAYIRLLV